MSPPAICRAGERCARISLNGQTTGPAINLMGSVHATFSVSALVPSGDAAGVQISAFTALGRDIWAGIGLAPTFGLTQPLTGGSLRLHLGAELPIVPNLHGRPVAAIPVLAAGATIADGVVNPYFRASVEMPLARTDVGTLTFAPGVTFDRGGPGVQLALSFRMGRFWDDAFMGHLFGE